MPKLINKNSKSNKTIIHRLENTKISIAASQLQLHLLKLFPQC